MNHTNTTGEWQKIQARRTLPCTSCNIWAQLVSSPSDEVNRYAVHSCLKYCKVFRRHDHTLPPFFGINTQHTTKKKQGTCRQLLAPNSHVTSLFIRCKNHSSVPTSKSSTTVRNTLPPSCVLFCFSWEKHHRSAASGHMHGYITHQTLWPLAHLLLSAQVIHRKTFITRRNSEQNYHILR